MFLIKDSTRHIVIRLVGQKLLNIYLTLVFNFCQSCNGSSIYGKMLGWVSDWRGREGERAGGQEKKLTPRGRERNQGEGMCQLLS